MLAVTGLSTTIVKEYLKIVPDEEVKRIVAYPNLDMFDCELKIPDADRYILAAGVLHQEKMKDQTGRQIMTSLSVNFINVVRICEEILEKNEHARICVIGSESAYGGSFDETYAGAKAALHRYVEKRTLRAHQQLVCVSPPIISDAGMTLRRHDYPEILKRRPTVTSSEVARLVYDLLNFECELNSVVVRMKGKL